MKITKIHNGYFKKIISSKEIQEVVKKLAFEVKNDLQPNDVPVFVGILNGCFMFVADFIREYSGNCEVSFIKLASYEGTKTSGKVKKLVGVNENLKNKTVIILEDIIDTGTTLQEVYEIFRKKNIKELKIATLFFKPDVYKKELHIDYIGKNISDSFVVGYGLDYNGLGRNLSGIYQPTKQPIMKNIVLFGPPGAGKGTQANVLKEKYKLIHISTGDVFRYNIKNKTKLGILAKSFIDKGDLVPDEVTINMLKKEVENNPKANGFIFDGFPRTISQAEALDEFLAEKNERINGMIALEVPEDLLVKRILERGKTSGRSDDQDENKIRNRFNEYATKTAPLKNYYQKQGNFFGVNGVGTIQEITNRLSEVFDTL